MRATGSTVAGGPREAVTVDLPREERISREEARARIAAGAARRNVAATSPFAAARAAEAADPERAAAVKAVAPTPTSRPKPTPAPAATSSATDLLAARRVDVAGIVQDYLDGDTVAAIAERRGHTTTTVRRILTDTPGITLRDETAKAGPPNAGRRTASMELRDEIAAVGLTIAALRRWAREHDVPVSDRGAVGRSVLEAYLAWQAAGSPDPVAPEPEPVAEPPAENEHPPTPPQDESTDPALDIPTPPLTLTDLAAALAAADHIPSPTRTAGPLDATLKVAASRSAVNQPDAPYIPHALAHLDRAAALADPLRQLGKALAALGGIAEDVATAIEGLSRASAQARDLAYPPDTPAEQAARRRALAAESRRRTR